MTHMPANQAKAHFGQLLDIAQREPVTIEKHGRPVAVVVSKTVYDEIEAMRLERLRAEARIGLDALAHGDYSEFDDDDLRDLPEMVKAQGRMSAE